MKSEKDKWIENVMASADEFRRIQPSANLDEKIFEAIAGDKKTMILNITQVRYGIAAAVVLLLLNVAVLAKFGKTDEHKAPTYFQSYNLDLY